MSFVCDVLSEFFNGFFGLLVIIGREKVPTHSQPPVWAGMHELILVDVKMCSYRLQ